MEIIDRLAYTVGLDLTGLKTDAAKHDYIITQMATKVKGANMSKEQAEIQLTQKLKQLTLSRKDFALWELGQEVGAFKKAKADQVAIAEYQAAKLKEIAGDGSLGGMLKRMGGVGGIGGLAAMAGITGGIAGVVMGFKSMVRAASDFEDAMAEVSTIVDTNTVNMRLMNDEVMQMSKTVPQSATELGKGLYQVISAGVPAAEAMSVLGVSAKAATAGITDSFTAVDAITTALNAYRLSTDQASYVSDLMFKTVEKGKLTFPELAGSLGNVASIAASASVNLEELFAAIATLTQGGIDAASATTYLSGLIAQIISPAEEAEKVVKQLGIGWNTAALQSKGLIPMIKELADATRKATSSEAEQLEMIMKIVPERRAARAMLALVGKQYEQLTVNLDAMNNSIGASEVAFEKMQETTSAQWQIFKNHLNVAAIEFGGSILPGMTAALKLFTGQSDNTVESLVRMKSQMEIQNKSLKTLEEKYGEWAMKIERVGGVTKLSAEEQDQYNTFLNSFKTLAPDAITAYDSMGNVIDVNVSMLDLLIDRQEQLFKMENQAQWNRLLENYRKHLEELQRLRDEYANEQKGTKFLGIIPTVYVGNAQQDILDIKQKQIGQMEDELQGIKNDFKAMGDVFVADEVKADLQVLIDGMGSVGDMTYEVKKTYADLIKDITSGSVPSGLFDKMDLIEILGIVKEIAKETTAAKTGTDRGGGLGGESDEEREARLKKEKQDAERRAAEEKKRIEALLQSETALYDKLLDKRNEATSTAYEFAVSKLAEQYRVEYDLMAEALRHRKDLTEEEKAARLKMLNDVYGAEMKKLDALSTTEGQEKIAAGLIKMGFKIDTEGLKQAAGDTTEELDFMADVIGNVGERVFEFAHDLTSALKGVLGNATEYLAKQLGATEGLSKTIGLGIPLIGGLAGSLIDAWASCRPLKDQLSDLRAEFDALTASIRSGELTRAEAEAAQTRLQVLVNGYTTLAYNQYKALLGSAALSMEDWLQKGGMEFGGAWATLAQQYQTQLDNITDMLAHWGEGFTDTWSSFMDRMQMEFDLLDIDEPIDRIHRLINAIGQAAGAGEQWAMNLWPQLLPLIGDLSSAEGQQALSDWIAGLFEGGQPSWWTGTGAEWNDFLSTFEGIGDEIIQAIETGTEATIEAQDKGSVDYRTAASITEGQWYETLGIWTTMRDYIRDIRDVALHYAIPGSLNMAMAPATVNLDMDIHINSSVNTPAQAEAVSETLAREFIRRARSKGVKIF